MNIPFLCQFVSCSVLSQRLIRIVCGYFKSRVLALQIIFFLLTQYDFADRRVGLCFRQLVAGRCTSHTDGLMSVTRADCCCTMGAAWGPRCEICPSPTSDDYQDLCLESGYSVDGHGKGIYNTSK